MKKVFGNLFKKTPSVSSNTNLSAETPLDSYDRQEASSTAIVDIATPTLSSSPSTQHERAMLVDASSAEFGSECLRLVNIVFQTSQTFPSIMGTCEAVNQYLRRELYKKYPNEYFQITIGENRGYGFSIDDGDYFAEIEQEQYRVIIFTTRLERKNNLTMHDANSQMMLEWK